MSDTERGHGVEVEVNGELAPGWLGGDIEALSCMTTSGHSLCGPGGCGVLLTRSPYAIVDLRVGWRINDHWQLSLRVNNVFDKTYYDSISENDFTCFSGEPRNFTLRVDGKF